jgi:hypothetical protein
VIFNHFAIFTITQVPSKQGETKCIPVTFEGKRKSVTVHLDSLQGTLDAIRQRFKIDDDFKLKAKVGTDEYFDIDDEDDLGDMKRANTLLVESLSEGTADGPQHGEAWGSKGAQGSMQAVPVNSQQLVPVDHNKTQVRSVFIVAGKVS